MKLEFGVALPVIEVRILPLQLTVQCYRMWWTWIAVLLSPCVLNALCTDMLYLLHMFCLDVLDKNHLHQSNPKQPLVHLLIKRLQHPFVTLSSTSHGLAFTIAETIPRPPSPPETSVCSSTRITSQTWDRMEVRFRTPAVLRQSSIAVGRTVSAFKVQWLRIETAWNTPPRTMMFGWRTLPRASWRAICTRRMRIWPERTVRVGAVVGAWSLVVEVWFLLRRRGAGNWLGRFRILLLGRINGDMLCLRDVV